MKWVQLEGIEILAFDAWCEGVSSVHLTIVFEGVKDVQGLLIGSSSAVHGLTIFAGVRSNQLDTCLATPRSVQAIVVLAGVVASVQAIDSFGVSATCWTSGVSWTTSGCTTSTSCLIGTTMVSPVFPFLLFFKVQVISVGEVVATQVSVVASVTLLTFWMNCFLSEFCATTFSCGLPFAMSNPQDVLLLEQQQWRLPVL